MHVSVKHRPLQTWIKVVREDLIDLEISDCLFEDRFEGELKFMEPTLTVSRMSGHDDGGGGDEMANARFKALTFYYIAIIIPRNMSGHQANCRHSAAAGNT